ncbi:NAD(P)-dependent dehydrogenase, short-chain alcohol dehydrogenase family [Marinobacter daqiaonensis]|uniref:NAD(P)-dependent dehydrogenase, short-chain alcohol dehydrogenase family n=1 Tax=Marinobacter daqiaonensis TaxID=650891 RepID=A0A1I6HJJ4_9GAMM|nr:SDR family oxidoreductase [Marinobacter daqiaonensis]SFR54633.1 NAD(P)-dependent dehydrogenase, short-chain alcohol dehydrogenase family [Marinobacter daqiaonensis]
MYKDDTLSGKVAFIAGGTSGINLGIAKGLAKVGAKVAVLGRDSAKAEAAAKEISDETGSKALAFSADVRDPEQVEQALADAVKELGQLDILISGAAGNFPAPAIGISPKGFKSVVDIDLLGTYNVFHLGFKHCNKGASLIAITAPQAVNPMAFQAHVCAAKAGINMLIKCLALEWGPAGIRVNGISPGPIDETEGLDRLAPKGPARERMIQQIAARRVGEKKDIADAAIYLCSDLGAYVNGTILTVDGGTELGDASADCLSLPERK